MLDVTSAYDLTFLFPAGDQAVGRSLRDHGEFSRVELDFFLEHSGGGAGALIDVGANIGSIALPFARQRPNWKVVAVEAHRGLAGVLAANALNNRLFNVEVFHAASGPARGLADFPATSLGETRNFGAIGFGLSGATEPVRMLPLDDLAPEDTRLVKVDVEGFEPEVLKGASRLIDSRKAIWLIEATVQHPEASTQVIQTMLEAGYQVFWFFVPFATPTSPKGQPVEPARGDANVVALPPAMANRWNLTRVGQPGEQRPGGGESYPYLSRYGY